MAILLALAALVAAQKVSFDRHFKVGDKDVFQLLVVGTKSGQPDSQMSMKWTEEVVKVYHDGGADISFLASEVKLGAVTLAPPPPGGAEQPPDIMRVTGVGSPNELDASNSVRISWPGNIYNGLAALKGGLSVGQSAPFKAVEPPLTNNHMHGTATLVGVTSDVATVEVSGETMLDFDVPSDYGHLKGTYTIQVSNAKLLKADFTFTDPAVRGGGVAHAVMTRDKS